MAVDLAGQWMGQYQGTHQGTFVIELDRMGSAFHGTATAWNSNYSKPSATFELLISNAENPLLLTEVPVQSIWGNGNTISPQEIGSLRESQGIVLPKRADFRITHSNNKITFEWKTDNGASGQGVATCPKTQRKIKSEIKPSRAKSWETFKNYVNRLDRKRYIFRGQENNHWRLRSSFYRAGRSSLKRFDAFDIQHDVRKVISALLPQSFNFTDRWHYLAALHLAQHHGYPTPLLDWTWSPYIAAFFAFRKIDHQDANGPKNVRIFKFDQHAWNILPRADKVFPFPPHVTILDPLAIGNSRAIPQQAISMFSNVDDIETHIQIIEGNTGRKFLEVFDLPISSSEAVFHELSMMGITAGALFPGLDGAFEALRYRNFSQ